MTSTLNIILTLSLAVSIIPLISERISKILKFDDRTLKLTAVMLCLTLLSVPVKTSIHYICINWLNVEPVLWWFGYIATINIIYAKYVVHIKVKFQGTICLIILLQSFVYGMAILEYVVPTVFVELLNNYWSEIKTPQLDFFWYITQNFEFIHSLHYLEILTLWMCHGRIATSNRHRFLYNLFGSSDRSSRLNGVEAKETL